MCDWQSVPQDAMRRIHSAVCCGVKHMSTVVWELRSDAHAAPTLPSLKGTRWRHYWRTVWIPPIMLLCIHHNEPHIPQNTILQRRLNESRLQHDAGIMQSFRWIFAKPNKVLPFEDLVQFLKITPPVRSRTHTPRPRVGMRSSHVTFRIQTRRLLIPWAASTGQGAIQDKMNFSEAYFPWNQNNWNKSFTTFSPSELPKCVFTYECWKCV